MTYALIYQNEVKNRFECENYELANILARASFGDKAFAVDASQYNSHIGDKYENGRFYQILEDGSLKEIEYIPSEKDNIAELQSKQIKSQICLTEAFENNLLFEDRILALQKNITDLYERMEVKK